MMPKRLLFSAGILCALAASAGWTYIKNNRVGEGMTHAAQAFLDSLNAEQRGQALMPYGSKDRLDWHFIPKDHRKGLRIKNMNEEQRKAAHRLLQAALSDLGYKKATAIMSLEKLLHELEGGQGRWPRDWDRYFFTIFGDPSLDARWGLSVEGHHLSLNFVVEHGHVLSTTPQVFCTNPAEVKNKNHSGFPVGTRILKQEELLAFELINGLPDGQRKTAILSDKAPREIRNPGAAQPPTAAPDGLAAGAMSAGHQALLRKLIDEYAQAMPERIAQARWNAIDKAGFQNVYFAWAGATRPGIGHYYRIQGPTFLIELVNTQPDAAGNPANHVHSIWRDMRGDFAIPIK